MWLFFTSVLKGGVLPDRVMFDLHKIRIQLSILDEKVDTSTNFVKCACEKSKYIIKMYFNCVESLDLT